MWEYDTGCSFCRIANKTEPASIIFENEQTIAFLDQRPLFPGHVLVLPREHIDCFSNLPVSLIPVLFTTIKMISNAVEKAMAADGSFIAVNNKVSQSVPHLHIHVVPRKRHDGLRGFFWPRTIYKSISEKLEVTEKIKKNLSFNQLAE